MQADARRDSLGGIEAFSVLFEDIGDENIERSGLDVKALQAQVELKLRQNNVKITEKRVPYLYININLVYAKNHYAYNITIEMKQSAKLNINQKEVIVSTWLDGTTGITPETEISQKTKAAIDNLMVIFLNDYLAANPGSRNYDKH